MAGFLAYNSDDPNTPGALLGANGVATIGPIQTGIATRIAGSVFADVAGSCAVQQCFDYWLPGNQVNPTPHWDCVDTIVVALNTPTKIDVDVIAPVCQVVYTNGAGAQTSHFRLFIRVFSVNRG